MKTDEQLRYDIFEALRWDTSIDETEVEAKVQGGIVTLTGYLSSYAEKHAIERAVARIVGVQAIVVEIEVRLSNSDKRCDFDIETAAQSALSHSVVGPASNLRILVEEGWITMNGELQWDCHRRAAERVLRELKGVVGVMNLVTIMPRRPHIDFH